MKRVLYILLFCAPFALIGLLIHTQNARLFIPYVFVTLGVLELVLRYLNRTQDNEWKTGMEVVWFLYQAFLIYILGREFWANYTFLLPVALAASAMISISFWVARRSSGDTIKKTSE